MPIRFDKANKRWRFEFDRYIDHARQRTSRLLPKGWTRAQADAFDLSESARLYAVATGVEREVRLIDDAVLVYLTEHAPRLKNRAYLEAELERCLPAYTGRPITDLPAVAREYATAQTGILTAATIKNRLAYLRAACRYAWKVHGYTEHDPAGRMVMPVVKNERKVYLDRRQMLAIARATTNRHARAAIRIGFYSGMRETEIKRAKVIDGQFWLEDTKNGAPRVIPVMPQVAHIVRNPRLWPLPISVWTISHHFTWANRKVGVPGAVFHSLRHSTASEMINGGVDLHTVGAVLGHKSPASTRRYAHLATATLGRALATVGQKVPHSPAKKVA